MFHWQEIQIESGRKRQFAMSGLSPIPDGIIPNHLSNQDKELTAVVAK
jgi:hypothetical protein